MQPTSPIECTKLVAIASLSVLCACVTVQSDIPGEDFEIEESGVSETPKKKEETPSEGSESSEKDGSKKSKTPEPSPKSNRDCEKIEWGKSLKKGEIVPLGETKGFADTDGDGVVEQTESDIGMCQLHETGKKCGLILAGRKGCPFCPGAFQSLKALLPKLKKADLALYLHFTDEEDLKEGFAALSSEKYLGFDYFHALSNKDSLGMGYAPRKALVDLRTMKVVELDQLLAKGKSVEELLKICNDL